MSSVEIVPWLNLYGNILNSGSGTDVLPPSSFNAPEGVGPGKEFH